MMHVPDEAAQRVSRIEALLDEAERVLSQSGMTDEATFSLRETRARYLPDTLRAYLDIPPSLRGERDAAGRTPDELLIAQLDHLERATAQRLREVAARSTDSRCLRSESTERATNEASAPSASDTGLNGWSSDP